MSKLQRFKDFVNERLEAAALEIFQQYEKELAECKEEICRPREKSPQLQRMLAFPPEIELTLHPTEPPQIKEQDLWTSQGGEQLQGLQSGTTDSIFTLDCGAPEPTSDAQPTSVTPDCPTAQSLEEVETRAIPRSGSGNEREDVSSGEAESKTAVKSYQCEECDKAYSQKRKLIHHRKIHTGEKPYQCEECDKAFYRKGSLNSHKRIHTGEKPYQCQVCNKAFILKNKFIHHKRMHTGEKPYQCQECDKAFSEKRKLICHRRIHTGERPYQCQECDKAFREKCKLIRHRKTHTGEKKSVPGM